MCGRQKSVPLNHFPVPRCLNATYHLQGTRMLKATHGEIPGKQVLALLILICFPVTEVFCHEGLFLSSELPFLHVFRFSPASSWSSWPEWSLSFMLQLCLIFFLSSSGIISCFSYHSYTDLGEPCCVLVSFIVSFAQPTVTWGESQRSGAQVAGLWG